jgi:hypothetical protein
MGSEREKEYNAVGGGWHLLLDAERLRGES